MLNRTARLLQIHPGEGAVSALMFTYIVGVLSFYYILKPLRSALFLADFPASDLPKAYLLTALIAGPLVTMVFKLSRRLSAIVLVTATNLGVIASLLIFRWAVGANLRFLPYAYFVYVQIIAVLAVSQFWLLAGYMYDSRQAKRIYGLLGAGAIAGSILGSLFTASMKQLSVSALLTICIGICVVLTAIGQAAWRYRRPEVMPRVQPRRQGESSERTADLLRTVFRSRHLSLMVLLVFFTMIASQIADWQVDSALADAYQDLSKVERGNAIKVFRANFNWATNILGVLLQLTVTHLVVKRIGIWAAVLFLPLALGTASLGVVFVPSLWMATLALGSNSVFRYSINRAGLELLFMPLSPEQRKKVKLFVDVFVDRVGRAAAAVVIIALTSRYLSFGLRGTAVVVVLLCGICIVVGIQLRKTYVNAFRQQLARREVDLEEFRRYVIDPASLQLLVAALEGGQERPILYSLRLLQSARGCDFSAQLLPLLEHPSPYVRAEALRTLPALPVSYEGQAERLLGDDSAEVRLAAAGYLCQHDPAVTIARIESLLNHEDPDIRLAAAHCAAEQPGVLFRPSLKLIRDIMAINGARSAQACGAAARLAAGLPTAESVPLMRELLQDRRPEVAAAAAKAAGTAGQIELVFDVLPMLVVRDLRAAARRALISYGPRVTGTLADVLGDERRDLTLRREIPWILSRQVNARACDALLENLAAADPMLKYKVIKALNRMHERNPDLPAARPLIAERILEETRTYCEALCLHQSLQAATPMGGSTSLLCRALQERLDRNLEIIFRLLGLRHPQRDIYNAFTAFKSSNRDRRISAIEFLDSLLSKNLKSLLLPLLEESSGEQLVQHASRAFGLGLKSREESLQLILKQSDSWLTACALHEIGAQRMRQLSDICRSLANSREPLIRETAVWALKNCG